MAYPGTRPLIGVTGPDGRFAMAWEMTRWAVLIAGGSPRRLTPSRSCGRCSLDGLIIGGGADIDPSLYSGVSDGSTRLDIRRDVFECSTIEHALARGLPMLGICRGAQLLNVVLGGSLHQDLRRLRKHTSNRRSVLARKTVILEPASLVRRVLETERCKVNSLHYQAVARLGKGLRTAASDLDGIVQAIESEEAPFVVGVQWHPEYLLYQRRQRRLFSALVGCARHAT